MFVRIRDFGSLHGTYVNNECIGKRDKNQTPSQGTNLELSEYDLKDGDVIRLSNTAFQVSTEDESLPTSTSIIPQEVNPDFPSLIDFDRNGDLGKIKGYTKIKLLGKGGFGKVYLARLPRETLYFMLTGAFPRNLTDKVNPMLEILTKLPVPIRQRDSSIPQSLADAIDRALIDNPSLYFDTAIAFKQALLNAI